MGKKLIGMLAGMGPRSTAPFIDLVVTECQLQYGARQVDDFPPMMIYSLPAPIYLDRPLNHQALKQTIGDGLRKLEATGADFIAIPCNTAHIYFDDLTKCLNVPLLSMIEETVKAIPATARRITLLATRMTVEAGFYQRGTEQAGAEFLLKDNWQASVDELVMTITSSPDSHRAQELWDQLIAQVAADEVDTIILGCTDLHDVSKRVPDGILVLDATQCLARAVVQRYRAD